MKKLKLKKRYKLNFIFYVILIIILYLIIKISLNNFTFINSNELFIKKLLSHSNSHLTDYDNNTITKELLKLVDINIENPITLLNKDVKLVSSEPVQMFNYINNQNIVSNPVIYIYNTHPLEYYIGDFQTEYNLNPGVLTATYLLQEKLNAIGLNTIVEENNVNNYLINNNLTYNDSYEVSRIFLQDKLNKYKDLKLIIDIHRDATTKGVSTTTINNESYAKVMLVMNKSYTNYNKAQTLHNIIETNYPTLTRNIFEKIYHFNQDLNTNVMLLEIGSDKNTYDEVLNTIDALVISIKEYLNE